MIATTAVRALIREGKTFQLPSMIQVGSKFGMQSLDQTLKEIFIYGLSLIGIHVMFRACG